MGLLHSQGGSTLHVWLTVHVCVWSYKEIQGFPHESAPREALTDGAFSQLTGDSNDCKHLFGLTGV